MKSAITLCILLLVSMATIAQADVVSWDYTAKKTADKTYEIRLVATIEPDWSIYSQHTPEGGPLPTTIKFKSNPLVTLNGQTVEIGELKQKFEEVFEVNVKYYSEKVEFVQKIKLKKKAKTNISGTIEFMACNNEQCLPPKTIPFVVKLN